MNWGVRKLHASSLGEWLIGRFVVALALLSGIACTMRRSAVWIADASSAADLRFGIGRTRGSTEPLDNLNFVRVAACGVGPNERGVGERILWLATGHASPESLAGEFRYGEPPRGLVTRQGPLPLTPGCYVIDISGEGISSGACFTVSPSGLITVNSDSVITCQVRDRAER